MEDNLDDLVVKGVDVYIGEHRKSRPIPFKKFVDDGVKICYIGVSEGDLVKDGGQTLYDLAKNAGLLVSAYHFLTPWTDGVKTFYDLNSEVETFLKAIKSFKLDLPCALDFEHYSASVSGEQRTIYCHTFAAKIWEATGMKPIVYTNERYVRKMFLENTQNKNSFEHGLEVYDLWVADYSGKINLPLGWTDWVGHQNDDKYLGHFDHNFFKEKWVNKWKK